MTAYLNALGLVCALGRGQADVAARLLAGDCSGMQPAADWVPGRCLPVGAVRGVLPTVPGRRKPVMKPGCSCSHAR